jgi:F-box protein 7
MGIKLRVRVVGADATQRLEVPELCTLAQLRQAVATKCCDPPCDAGAVAITLNRTDDVGAHGAVGESTTLGACGISRGDLVHVFQVPWLQSTPSRAST